MRDSRFDRRTLLKNVLVGVAALPAANLMRDAAAQDAVPHISEQDSLAVAMGYVHDASQLDPNKVPQFKPGAKCANCAQLAGNEGDQWRPYNLFVGKLVNADGWCKVWVIKPGAKI